MCIAKRKITMLSSCPSELTFFFFLIIYLTGEGNVFVVWHSSSMWMRDILLFTHCRVECAWRTVAAYITRVNIRAGQTGAWRRSQCQGKCPLFVLHHSAKNNFGHRKVKGHTDWIVLTAWLKNSLRMRIYSHFWFFSQKCLRRTWPLCFHCILGWLVGWLLKSHKMRIVSVV